LAATGWLHSDLPKGRDIIHSGPDKAHINTRFGRYHEDGSTIGEYDSIYIVNKQDNHWGIQGRSSFAP